MNSIVSRIETYLNSKKIAISVAEKQSNLANGTLSKAINTHKSIKTDTLEKFLIYFNDINPKWLLTGEGDMINTAIDTFVLDKKHLEYKRTSKAETIDLHKIIAAQEKTIKAQEKTIAALEKAIR